MADETNGPVAGAGNGPARPAESVEEERQRLAATGLPDLEAQAKEGHERVMGSMRISVQEAIRTGEVLRAIKQMMGGEPKRHDWHSYLRDKARWPASPLTARIYVRLAVRRAEIEPELEQGRLKTIEQVRKWLTAKDRQKGSKRKARKTANGTGPNGDGNSVEQGRASLLQAIREQIDVWPAPSVHYLSEDMEDLRNAMCKVERRVRAVAMLLYKAAKADGLARQIAIIEAGHGEQLWTDRQLVMIDRALEALRGRKVQVPGGGDEQA